MEQKSSPFKSDNSNIPQTGSSDEKAPDSSENCLQKNKGGWPKGKKRGKPGRKNLKDASAPKHPRTGYVRFMNERREVIKANNPGVGFTEITRMLAEEWGSLPTSDKKQYLDAAEQDRERYAREVDQYKQNSDKKSSTAAAAASTLAPAISAIHKSAPVVSTMPIDKDNKPSDFSAEFDIPIFTEEFLEHNKVREAELRQLRKSNTDYEQQNAILQKHIENMRTAIDKLENETSVHKSNNNTLQNHLDKLRGALVQGFQNVSLPGGENGASHQNIDDYMLQLQNLAKSGGNQGINSKARDIISRLDLPMH